MVMMMVTMAAMMAATMMVVMMANAMVVTMATTIVATSLCFWTAHFLADLGDPRCWTAGGRENHSRRRPP
jgi:hypothetical protein